MNKYSNNLDDVYDGPRIVTYRNALYGVNIPIPRIKNASITKRSFFFGTLEVCTGIDNAGVDTILK